MPHGKWHQFHTPFYYHTNCIGRTEHAGNRSRFADNDSCREYGQSANRRRKSIQIAQQTMDFHRSSRNEHVILNDLAGQYSEADGQHRS
jgi:hypothetical protein